ncbi:hypothetical protein ACJQWY_06320 [Weissella kandleri]|uniref:hypothetical protein n=1 Tax=Weissella kandleri TaxID=1616 RepID=UPI00387E48E9
MFYFIILVLIGVGVWVTHSKFGIEWAKIAGTVGAGLVATIALILHNDNVEQKQHRENIDKVVHASNAQLVEWALQYEDENLRIHASGVLKDRFGSNWKQIL